MKAATMCEFSKQEFIGGLQGLGIDSLEKFCEKIPFMRMELKDDRGGKELGKAEAFQKSKLFAFSEQEEKVSKIYSKAEVLVHNKKTDCWIIIKDKVYDVTAYIEEHPGGDAILAHAGDDSTEGFYGVRNL
ncbi:hypothetical protein SO802_017332 [Lithocarpus litseifolius]|uniref:Cytochrome b5 heme-binding domain-containing protein n=1 Tax=Lithocarpus litseifolius TaxID=425828 RepID=A0AAW2CZP4_9ROSI